MEFLTIIDMGHGGNDPGAHGNGVTEKIANYDTGMALKAYLERNGVKVLLTRTGDKTMELSTRTELANKYAREHKGYKTIFVSVHHNAGGGDRGEYIHSIVMGDSKKLADKIGETMLKELGQQKKVYSKKGSSNKDYYFVIRNTSMPAVIVEVAFLDNKKDVQICDTVAERKRNGEIIGKGILSFAGIKPSSNSEKPKPSKPAEKPQNSNELKVGCKVKVKGSKYATGQTIPDWVKKDTHTVKEVKKDKSLLKEINSWVLNKDLTVI